MATTVKTIGKVQIRNISEKMAREIQLLDWDNVHSLRIRAECNDPQLCIAYSPKLNCWVLARKIDVLVGESPGTLMRLPIVWKEWREDDTKKPLSPNHPQLSQYIRECDTHQSVVAQRIQDDLDAAEKAEVENEQKRLTASAEAFAEMMKPHLSQMASDDGFVSHRKGGHEGGKISTAALWRDTTQKKVIAA